MPRARPGRSAVRATALAAAATAVGVACAALTGEGAKLASRWGGDAANERNASASTGAAPHEAPPPPPPPAPPPPARPFNVLLVTIDTLRADLGFAGYPRPVSPNLDALAARSAVYERAYALASYTPKSLGPMLVGKYATETFRDGEHYTTFYPANVFLAERLRDAGVRTLAATCHRYFVWKTGFEQGFDVWDTTATPPGMVDEDPRLTGEALTDAVVGLLSDPENAAPAAREGGAPGRFFAWAHYLDPHSPYVAHPEAPRFVGADGGPDPRTVYDEEVWYTDAQIGRLLAFVDAQPWGKETAVVVTADHGEAFGENGHWKHGREVWETLVRVPLLVRVPGLAPRRIATKRSLIDLVPTVLDLLGVEAPEGELRGRSLLADLEREAGAPEERDVFVDMPSGPFNEARRALVFGGTPGTKVIDRGTHLEVYDLEADPREARNLAGVSERRREAREALDAFTRPLKVVAPGH